MTIDTLVREFHAAMDIPVVPVPAVPSDAREFGVLKTTISAIKTGRNWRHLSPAEVAK